MKPNKNDIKFYQKGLIEIIEGKGKVTFPYHSHNCFMVGAIISGSNRMKIHEKDYQMKSGAVFIVPSNTGMSMDFITCFSYISICIKGKLAQRMNGYNVQNNRILGIGITIEALCNQFKQNENEEEFVNALIHILKLEKKKANNHFLCNEIKNKGNSTKEIIEKAINYMNCHVFQKCSVEDIAKELFVSKFYFCRLFKKEMGITPKQYMIQMKLRMLKTKIMEEETETKIAEDMEFAAQSHMCSIFKKYMGVSIKEYKNNLTVK